MIYSGYIPLTIQFCKRTILNATATVAMIVVYITHDLTDSVTAVANMVNLSLF